MQSTRNGIKSYSRVIIEVVTMITPDTGDDWYSGYYMTPSNAWDLSVLRETAEVEYAGTRIPDIAGVARGVRELFIVHT